jgi:hypothetical protein
LAEQNGKKHLDHAGRGPGSPGEKNLSLLEKVVVCITESIFAFFAPLREKNGRK